MVRFLFVCFFAVGALAPAAGFGAVCAEPPGDVNGDSMTTVTDAQCAILTAVVSLGGQAPPTCLPLKGDGTLHLLRADLSCDGVVTVADVLLVIQHTLGAGLPPQIDTNGDGCVDACASACLEAIWSQDGGWETILVTGTGCDDGNACTEGDMCQAGVCTAGTAVAEGCGPLVEPYVGWTSLHHTGAARITASLGLAGETNVVLKTTIGVPLFENSWAVSPVVIEKENETQVFVVDAQGCLLRLTLTNNAWDFAPGPKIGFLTSSVCYGANISESLTYSAGFVCRVVKKEVGQGAGVACYDATTLELDYFYPALENPTMSPIILKDGMLLFDDGGNTLVAAQMWAKNLLWVAALPSWGNEDIQPVVGVDGSVFVVTAKWVTKIRPDGVQAFSKSLTTVAGGMGLYPNAGTSLAPPALTATGLVVGARNSRVIHCLNPETGNVLWKSDLTEVNGGQTSTTIGVNSFSVRSDGNLLVSLKNQVVLVSQDTGQVIQVNGAPAAFPPPEKVWETAAHWIQGGGAWCTTSGSSYFVRGQAGLLYQMDHLGVVTQVSGYTGGAPSRLLPGGSVGEQDCLITVHHTGAEFIRQWCTPLTPQ